MKKSLFCTFVLLISFSYTVLSTNTYPQSPAEKKLDQMDSILPKDTLKFGLTGKGSEKKNTKLLSVHKKAYSYKLLWQKSIEYLSPRQIISASFEGGSIITDWYHQGRQDTRVNIFIKQEANSTQNSILVKAFSRIHTKNIMTETNPASEDPQLAEKIRRDILESIGCEK